MTLPIRCKQGRHHFPHKRVILGSNTADMLQALNQRSKEVVKTASSQTSSRPVVFLFPGQGSQYVDMGRQLYDKYPVFKEALDQCLNQFKQHVSVDPFSILFSTETSDDRQLINQTEYTQPILFSVEYALAKLLIHFWRQTAGTDRSQYWRIYALRYLVYYLLKML
ncbi:acyltransferase domain-containing protein [Bacillus sp. SL00103]